MFGIPNDSGTALTSLTVEQVQVLMNLINNEQYNSERMTGEDNGMQWIIDIGALHHITGTLSSLSNVREV